MGGHLYKMRVGRPGQGKRGGVRTVVALRIQDKAFFVYGFAKSARGNIEASELKALQRLASELLGYEEKQLRLALAAGELQEVN
ncbi:MAG: type II toxin-antitoxin system RelE/ParE family toxin [Nitrococcus sp.]|nr:type II toxin-antitoxin system RelE/ParE family toxin [Nitrococcus sp.]